MAAIGRHNLFARGDRVGVAVSGGADSVCLLHVLLRLAPKFDLQLSVVHLDHQLRGTASEEDAAFVAALAHNHDLPLHLERLDVRAWAAGSQDNLEQAAREARLRFFRRLRAEEVVDKVATGHTRSDQAETVLFRFLRGSGTSGLAGILPSTSEGIVRPLLDVTRAQVEQFLQASKVPWRADETNNDAAFTRNRIRLELLPLLERDYNPAVAAQLAQTADWARDEEAFWEEYLERVTSPVSRTEGPCVVITCPEMNRFPRALGRRILRWACKKVKGNLRQIEFQHTELLLGLSQGPDGHGRVQIPGLDILRSFEWLRIAPLGLDSGSRRIVQQTLMTPGETTLPWGGVRIRSTIEDNADPPVQFPGYNGGEGDLLDWEKLEKPLTLRYWLPGDAYQRRDATQTEKVKQMFQNGRIPLWERKFWPILETSQGIVWTRKFGSAAAVEATRATTRRLRIEEIN